MPRIPRLVVPGYPHHVTQRGNRRQKTFFCTDDYLTYLDFIEAALPCSSRKPIVDIRAKSTCAKIGGDTCGRSVFILVSWTNRISTPPSGTLNSILLQLDSATNRRTGAGRVFMPTCKQTTTARFQSDPCWSDFPTGRNILVVLSPLKCFRKCESTRKRADLWAVKTSLKRWSY